MISDRKPTSFTVRVPLIFLSTFRLRVMLRVRVRARVRVRLRVRARVRLRVRARVRLLYLPTKFWE